MNNCDKWYTDMFLAKSTVQGKYHGTYSPDWKIKILIRSQWSRAPGCGYYFEYMKDCYNKSKIRIDKKKFNSNVPLMSYPTIYIRAILLRSPGL
jgi:hypothetical protein